MTPLKVHGFSTGQIQVKTRFLNPRGHGLAGGLLGSLAGTVTDRRFSAPLPVWCWVIEHPQGLVVVDTGLTGADTGESLFGRTQTRVSFASGDRLSDQLRAAGLAPERVTRVVFTHLHLDHDRGAGDFPEAQLLASARELADYQGPLAAPLGYSRPTWTRPATGVTFGNGQVGPFPASHDLFGDGQVLLLPTPGHTAGHLSVLVRGSGRHLLLAGDLTYSEAALRREQPGGILMHGAAHAQSIRRVLAYARQQPLVYLPSHDPDALTRLHTEQVVYLPDTGVEQD